MSSCIAIRLEYVATTDDRIVVIAIDGSRPDLALVDALARFQLAALRRGWSLRIREPCDELLELLDLAGLADLLLEPRREAEGAEQIGVEEVVELDDPSA